MCPLPISLSFALKIQASEQYSSASLVLSTYFELFIILLGIIELYFCILYKGKLKKKLCQDNYRKCVKYT